MNMICGYRSEQKKILDEYDMRVSVRTKEDPEFKVQSLTIVTPAGTSFNVMRNDKAAMDQIDPEFGIEIIRGFELKGEEGVWTFAGLDICGHSQ